MRTIGLGNALVDVLLQLENDDVLPEVGISKGAMDMIGEEQMHAIRQAQENLERTQTPGGSACNTMRALSKLGAMAGFIGKIGSDDVGRYYAEAVRQAGVLPYFIRTEGVSGSCTVLISPDGERTMGTFLGPAATITPDEVTEQMLRPFDCIYIEGYLIVNEPLMRGTMRRAKELGLRIALDLSNYNIVNGFKPLLEDIVPRWVDILFCNESEALAFTGLSAQDAVRELARRVEVSVVTLGKEGALVCRNGEVWHVPAEGGKPLDTTGAGDHFAAGFLYGLSVDATLEQSAQLGSMLAGFAIDVIGPEIPDRYWEQIKLKVNHILG